MIDWKSWERWFSWKAAVWHAVFALGLVASIYLSSRLGSEDLLVFLGLLFFGVEYTGLLPAMLVFATAPERVIDNVLLAGVGVLALTIVLNSAFFGLLWALFNRRREWLT